MKRKQYKAMVLPLFEGFIDEENQIACYTDHQIFERYHKFSIKNGYSKSVPANFEKKSIFVDVPNAVQYVIVLLDDDEDIEEARNAVADFSNKGFKLAKVKVSQKMTLTEKNFVLVQEFQSAKIAGEYINAYKAGFEYLDDFQNNKIYIINQENLKKLIETSKFDEYKGFFIDNY